MTGNSQYIYIHKGVKWRQAIRSQNTMTKLLIVLYKYYNMFICQKSCTAYKHIDGYFFTGW